MNIYGEIRYYAFDRDFLCVLIVQFVCVCFDVTNQMVFVRSQGCRSERYKAINPNHLHLAVV